MKKILALIPALILSFTSFAQSAEEILAKMDAAVDAASTAAGDAFYMEMDIKMPIIGTMSSKAWMKGEKMYIEAKMMGENILSWSDGVTEWSYAPSKNELTITDDKKSDNSKGSSADENRKMLDGITDGYNVSIQKETADAWYIKCKKRSDNTEKDDPKTMDLVVRKADYMPASLSAKLSGVGLVMKNMSFEVSDEDVTYHPERFASAKVIDKRGESEKK